MAGRVHHEPKTSQSVVNEKQEGAISQLHSTKLYRPSPEGHPIVVSGHCRIRVGVPLPTVSNRRSRRPTYDLTLKSESPCGGDGRGVKRTTVVGGVPHKLSGRGGEPLNLQTLRLSAAGL